MRRRLCVISRRFCVFSRHINGRASQPQCVVLIAGLTPGAEHQWIAVAAGTGWDKGVEVPGEESFWPRRGEPLLLAG
jgi:hypothetical protein